MKRLLFTISLFVSIAGFSQNTNVLGEMKKFHELLVKGDPALAGYLHDSLTYGHSNGWVESAKEFKSDLGDIIVYHSYTEDSIRVSADDRFAHIRFTADIEATLRGKRTIFHLRVLEVWVNDKGRWKLFARQGIK